MTDKVGTEAGIDKGGTHLTTGITAIQAPAPSGVPGARKAHRKIQQVRFKEERKV